MGGDDAVSRWVEQDVVARFSGGLPGAVGRLCEVFLRTLPLQLETIRSSLRTGDAPALREAAHTLFATVSAFSTAAGGQVRRLERAAEREDLPACQSLGARLDTICAELAEEVARLATASRE
jgi:hypothetical protein